ncbi:MAG: sigma-70 family RNA polymerase sigma factor, partial [Clostridia bacterium]
AVSYDNSKGKELRESILKLPPKLKNVILLFYYEGMSVKEIADTLKSSEGSVKTRLNRARNLLKEELE